MRSVEILLVVLVACGPAVEDGGGTEAVAGGGTPGDPAPAEPVATAVSVLERYDFTTPGARFELPGRLDEISGLAMTGDGRIFGHDDERGRVHEIDGETGRVGKSFDLGSGDVLDDFEGIAVAGDRFFLVSSHGFLYEFREGADEADVPYRVTDTGLGGRCEVEGLDFDASADALLFACKRSDGGQRSITLYTFPVSGGAPTAIHVDRSALAGVGLDSDFEPSAVAVSGDGTLVLLSAATESILEIDRDGQVLGGVTLGRRNHPQPEGLAIAPNGTMYIADEQNGDDAHLTVYIPESAYSPKEGDA